MSSEQSGERTRQELKQRIEQGLDGGTIGGHASEQLYQMLDEGRLGEVDQLLREEDV